LLAAERAATSRRLSVLTYNIHHGEGSDGELDLERIAKVISAAEPDLVSLQEVEHQTSRTGRVPQAEKLGELTGLKSVFGGNIRLLGGQYGNAVLTRLPIRKYRNHKLPNVNRGEQRGFLTVEFAWPTDDDTLLFVATHFDHRPSSDERQLSAQAINELVEQRVRVAVILAGDFNTIPSTREAKVLLDKWTSTNSKHQPTFPADKPEREIDYILVRPAIRWKVVEAEVLDEPVASDHRPLLATLEFVPPS
jgi:endonuclease/exonuclease/phosphatase family metal-dependent hydrolase